MADDRTPGLEHFLSALALGEGFQFHIVVCASAPQVSRLLQHIRAEVPRPVRTEHWSPYASAPGGLPAGLPGLGAWLAQRLAELAPPGTGERLVVALDAMGGSQSDESAWRDLFRRLNEQRNTLVGRLDAVLLLCIPSSLYHAFAHEAPDFWSIRGVSADLQPLPSETLLAPGQTEQLAVQLTEFLPAGEPDYAAAAARVAELRAVSGNTPETGRDLWALGSALISLSDRAFETGRSSEALSAAQEARELLEALVQSEPQRADYQRDLSVSYERLGDLMRALGEGEAARQYFEKSLEIAERLVRAEPQRADYQRDLAVSYNKLGDLMGALGEGEAARQYFEKSLEIRERLVRAEPQRADYQRDLVVSLWRMAQIDAPRSRIHLSRALAILQGLRGAGRHVAQIDEMIAALEQRLDQGKT